MNTHRKEKTVMLICDASQNVEFEVTSSLNLIR